MLGVILCGGESTRMGRDKGLIPGEGKTWAGLAAEKLAVTGIRVVLSVNDRQVARYTRLFSNERLIREHFTPDGMGLDLISDDPALRLRGPLVGLLSVHKRYPSEDLFVLACDVPLMEPGLLKDLYLRKGQQNDAQAWLYTIDGEPEPLCAIYAAKGLARIIHLYEQQLLSRHSMKYALDQLTVDSLPVPEDKKNCFKNFNYPSDPQPPARVS